MSETSLKFHVLPSGDIDCWLQVDGGPTQSFDPAQLPDKLAACIDALVVSQQVAVEQHKATIAQQGADLAALTEELDKAKGVIESQRELLINLEAAEVRAADYAAQLAAAMLATPAPQEAAPAPSDVP